MQKIGKSTTCCKVNLEKTLQSILAGSNPEPLRATYRDILLTKGIEILPASQYTLTDNLFVVTTSDEDRVRRDPANIMDRFREGKLADKFFLKNSDWKVYLFEVSQK